jgi:uncharacterized membrane protein YjgN (DUF898 family)
MEMMGNVTREEPGLAAAGPGGLDAARTQARYRVEFHGTTGEYFGIWIVNVLLGIVTLGLYSAWAKVRTQRYFYANTRLAGSSFEYLADPIRILKGRLVAYAFVIALGLAVKFQVWWAVAPMYLLVLGLFPALIWLGLRFRARYSAWRGLRFKFDAPVGGAYGKFMGLPLLSVFTLNLIYPWVHMEQQKYMVEGHAFGGERFRFHGEAGMYYRPFLIALGLGIVAMLGLFGGMAAVVGGSGGAPGAGASTAIMLVALLFYAGIFALSFYVHACWINLLWCNTRLGEHRFESALSPATMIGLYFTNGLAIAFSLGLAIPWARIRLMRYRAECLSVLTEGSLDDFVGQALEAQSAIGAELSQALDLDLDVAL